MRIHIFGARVIDPAINDLALAMSRQATQRQLQQLKREEQR